ncbi:MAG: DUF3883 domain-containing protein [Alphaproteobacteria bacterium]|nr:DUF3883 domain-containing protein [Alphaproteobacteria bacterium]
MDKFFKLHKEQIIGYKSLTDADLGLSSSSHQTHIGLFDDVLTFLPNRASIDDCAMFIYQKNVELLSLNFDRIQNPNGTFRSPKIKTGGRDTVSIVSAIRDIVKQSNKQLIWYLFWFGLESEQVVFWLFNNESEAYLKIKELGLALNTNSKGRLTISDNTFKQILVYIEQNIDISAQDILKDLEIEAQTCGKLLTKIRTYDIEKARAIFASIGKQGEEYINNYFDKLMFEKRIKNFCWENKSLESGKPFDFYYQDLSDNIIYLDVKTTKFDFEQRIIYSDKEINFAVSCPKRSYNIYRVYNITDDNANLRICEDCLEHFNLMNNNILEFKQGLTEINTEAQSINIAFQPNIEKLFFYPQIILSK